MKGSRSEFGSQRFIHSKDEVKQNSEALVIEKVKPKIVNRCSKYQIGGLPGHQPAEHLFALKSVIDLRLKQGKITFLNESNLRKCFNSQILSMPWTICIDLFDCMN